MDQLIRSLGTPGGSRTRSLASEAASLFTPSAVSGTGNETAGGQTGAGTSAALTQIESLMQTLVATTTEITKGIGKNTAPASSSNSSADIGKTIANVFTSGLGLGPIVSGLLQIFGGGQGDQQDAPAPLTKFSLPSSLSLDAGISGGGLGPADYGHNGLPRSASPAASTNVTVQVNAMDSRSILDRSDDIASAVRRAMLESSALNDVVSEI